MLGSSRISVLLLLVPAALCPLTLGCASRPGDARSAVLESFRNQGDFRRFEDDGELHAASATFDGDRERLLANPSAFFSVGPETGCSLDSTTLYKVTGLDASFRSLDLADTEGEVSAEKMKYAVHGGRCEGGVARGPLDLRVEWTDLVVFPERKGTSRVERAMRFFGTLGKSGFEGRLVTFAFTGKMQTRVKVVGEIVDVPDDSPFDATYSITYSDMKSFMPRVLNRRAVSFRFDRSNSMHVASVTESLPDLRLKVTTWSGAEKASENIVTSELIQDGWQLSYAQRIAGIEIPGSRTCMKQGRAAPENACGEGTSRVE